LDARLRGCDASERAAGMSGLVGPAEGNFLARWLRLGPHLAPHKRSNTPGIRSDLRLSPRGCSARRLRLPNCWSRNWCTPIRSSSAIFSYTAGKQLPKQIIGRPVPTRSRASSSWSWSRVARESWSISTLSAPTLSRITDIRRFHAGAFGAARRFAASMTEWRRSHRLLDLIDRG
jgi:hypothetical protein